MLLIRSYQVFSVWFFITHGRFWILTFRNDRLKMCNFFLISLYSSFIIFYSMFKFIDSLTLLLKLITQLYISVSCIFISSFKLLHFTLLRQHFTRFVLIFHQMFMNWILTASCSWLFRFFLGTNRKTRLMRIQIVLIIFCISKTSLSITMMLFVKRFHTHTHFWCFY